MEDLKRDTNIEYITKLYRYMRHGTSVEDFMMKYHIKSEELKGILELCRIYGKNIDIIEKNGTLNYSWESIDNNLYYSYTRCNWRKINTHWDMCRIRYSVRKHSSTITLIKSNISRSL